MMTVASCVLSAILVAAVSGASAFVSPVTSSFVGRPAFSSPSSASSSATALSMGMERTYIMVSVCVSLSPREEAGRQEGGVDGMIIVPPPLPLLLYIPVLTYSPLPLVVSLSE